MTVTRRRRPAWTFGQFSENDAELPATIDAPDPIDRPKPLWLYGETAADPAAFAAGRALSKVIPNITSWVPLL